jgi:hypothetical protein
MERIDTPWRSRTWCLSARARAGYVEMRGAPTAEDSDARAVVWEVVESSEPKCAPFGALLRSLETVQGPLSPCRCR